MNIHELMDRLMDHYNKKDYAGALTLATAAVEQFPAAAQDLAWWRVCMAAQAGEPTLALAVFQDALEQGFWYPPETLRSDPDLAAIRDEAEFDRLAAICAERAHEARRQAVSQCLTVEPDTAGTAGTNSLLIALHGNGGSAAGTVDHWRPLVQRGWRLALPDSGQTAGTEYHRWEDWEWAEAEIAGHYQTLIAHHSLSPQQVVFGGISMGAGLSIWLPLKGATPAAGFIAVAPWLQSHDIRPWLEAGGGQGLRGCMIVGDQDTWCYPVALECKALFDQYGIPCHLEVVPGLGHTYPDGFEQYLERALAFIAAR